MNRIEQLLDFLKQTPNDCFLKHALALEYIKLGRDQEAEVLFKENMAFDDKYIATYYHLAKLLERQNRIQEAINIYEKGLVQAQAIGDRHAFAEMEAALEDLTD
jgi:Tfp pilus assembly protein PilF